MAQDPQTVRGEIRTVVVDLVVAIVIFLLGALVVYDSYLLGSGWASDGPQAGYFPYYIGLLICISSLVTAAQTLFKLKHDTHVFVERDQLRQVMVILLPSLGYVLGVQFIGIYISSAVFIGLFMRIVGKYSWLRSIVVGTAVSVISFMLFEVWFKIPLPKGPLEEWLGY
jgi:putative tricarboxylic transport membrane protein